MSCQGRSSAHGATLSHGNSRKNAPCPPFAADGIRDNVATVTWLCWEMAMSEVRQQTIALWILLMLLLMIPWILE